MHKKSTPVVDKPVETVLISFCNQSSSPSQSICAIDLAQGDVSWIDLSPIPAEYRIAFGGVTGVCVTENEVVIATQGEKPVLAILDMQSAKVKAFVPMVKCKDLHSVVFHSGYVYVVSTGTNEIYRVSMNDELFGTEELYWQYPDVKHDRDEVHLNGLTFSNGRFIASCFGNRTDKGGWGSNGRVFYLDNGFNIHEGLNQPHSPTAKSGRLAFAESKLERVYLYAFNGNSGEWQLQHTFDVCGYARGIAFLDQAILVGLSADRKVSRSQSIYLEDSKPLRPSALVRVDIDTGGIAKIPRVEFLGREIYDLVYTHQHIVLGSFDNTLAIRLNSMESVILDQTVAISKLAKEKQSLCLEHQKVLDRYNQIINHPFKTLVALVARVFYRKIKRLC